MQAGGTCKGGRPRSPPGSDCRHRRGVCDDLDLVTGEFREGEAHGHLFPAVPGTVVLAGGEFDYGVARRVEGQASMLARTHIRAARARLTPRRALGGFAAVGAKPSCAQSGVAPPAGGILLLPIPPVTERGAGAAERGALESRLAAASAQTRSSPCGVQLPLDRAPLLAAGFTTPATLYGRSVSATRAQARLASSAPVLLFLSRALRRRLSGFRPP